MATTYTLISSNTLGSNTASVTFSSIPSTYTDLVLKFSTRNTAGNSTITITINSDSGSNYSRIVLYGDGSAGYSEKTSNATSILFSFIESSTQTTNTFSSSEIYFPSYTVSQNKPIGYMSATEENVSIGPYVSLGASLWRNTATISSITLTGNPNLIAGSSFYLYGIKNS